MGKVLWKSTHLTALLFLLVITALFIAAPAITAMEMKSAKPETVGISSERLARLNRAMQEMIDNKETGGIVVLIAAKAKWCLIRHSTWRTANPVQN